MDWNPQTIERRISEGAVALKIGIRLVRQRPDFAPAGSLPDIVYLVRDIFTTMEGSWEPKDHPHPVPLWARDAYLKPFGAPDWFDDAGANHHLFAAVLGLDGELIPHQEFLFWSDGFERLGDPTQNERTFWLDQYFHRSRKFVPEHNETGPWCWAPESASDIVCGGGLPANQHISTFTVWQAVRRQDLMTDADQIDEDNENDPDSDSDRG